jgi:hypothetical protein
MLSHSIDPVPSLDPRDMLIEHTQSVTEHNVEMPEIRN